MLDSAVRARRVTASRIVILLVLISGVTAGCHSGPQGLPPSVEPTVTGSAVPPAEPSFPTQCVAARLAVPDGLSTGATVTGGDPTGRFITGQVDGGGELLIWDGGEPIRVGISGVDAKVVDVNSSGEAIVYTDYFGGSASHYHDGIVTRLKGVNPRAIAINESGVMAGMADGMFVTWDSPTSDPVPLPLPEKLHYGYGVAGIDDDGTVMGDVYVEGFETAAPTDDTLFWERLSSLGPRRAAKWLTDGTMVEAPVPALEGKTPVRIEGYHGGWVRLGYLPDPIRPGDPDWLPVYQAWNVDGGALRPAELDDRSALNRFGWVVADLDADAVLQSEGAALTLPRSAAADYSPGFIRHVVAFLSDDGRTVAGHAYGPDGRVPIVWRCR